MRLVDAYDSCFPSCLEAPLNFLLRILHLPYRRLASPALYRPGYPVLYYFGKPVITTTFLDAAD
jgi:hypothetical protein